MEATAILRWKVRLKKDFTESMLYNITTRRGQTLVLGGPNDSMGQKSIVMAWAIHREIDDPFGQNDVRQPNCISPTSADKYFQASKSISQKVGERKLAKNITDEIGFTAQLLIRCLISELFNQDLERKLLGSDIFCRVVIFWKSAQYGYTTHPAHADSGKLI